MLLPWWTAAGLTLLPPWHGIPDDDPAVQICCWWGCCCCWLLGPLLMLPLPLLPGGGGALYCGGHIPMDKGITSWFESLVCDLGTIELWDTLLPVLVA